MSVYRIHVFDEAFFFLAMTFSSFHSNYCNGKNFFHRNEIKSLVKLLSQENKIWLISGTKINFLRARKLVSIKCIYIVVLSTTHKRKALQQKMLGFFVLDTQKGGHFFLQSQRTSLRFYKRVWVYIAKVSSREHFQRQTFRLSRT